MTTRSLQSTSGAPFPKQLEETADWYRTMSLGQREALRTTRLLDSRLRTMGVDKDALDMQVFEKEQAKAQTTAVEVEAAEAMNMNLAAANSLAAAAASLRAADLAATVSTWDAQRDKTRRREWDLSDPAQVRKATLPRNTAPLYETRDFGHPSNAQVRLIT